MNNSFYCKSQFIIPLIGTVIQMLSATLTHAAECSNIKGSEARLQCYDQEAKPIAQQDIDTPGQSYEGIWAPDFADCTVPRDGNFTISGKSYTGHESTCKIQRIIPTGSGWRMNLDCEGEGEKYSKEITIEMSGNNRITSNAGGVKSKIYVRCESKKEGTKNWKEYKNVRTGVYAIYPSHLIDNGIMTDIMDGMPGSATRLPTGMRYEGQGGIEVAIYGSTQSVDNPYSYICQKKCDGETYSVKKPKLAIASGNRGAFIFYKKCILPSDNKPHCFEIEYPRVRSKEFDQIIDKISRSLK